MKELPVPVPDWMRKGTTYFEVESKTVGATFAVWVTVPLAYDKNEQQEFLAHYAADGNSMVELMQGRPRRLHGDLIHAIQPYVQVSVGYLGQDAQRALAVRARDLLPPGEPLPPGAEESVRDTVEMGLVDAEGAELYIQNLKSPHADRFRDFLVEELHPEICKRFRVIKDEAAFYGFSYGGLFAAYLALSKTDLFKTIGAGSPGIYPGNAGQCAPSRVLTMFDELAASDADFSSYRLHVTVCEPELIDPVLYADILGTGTLALMTKARRTPLKGLTFSSNIIPSESHVTGFVPSHNDFLRQYFLERSSVG